MQAVPPPHAPPPEAEKCPPELLLELLGSEEDAGVLSQMQRLNKERDRSTHSSRHRSHRVEFEEVEVSTEESFSESTDEEGHHSEWKFSIDHAEIGAPPTHSPPPSAADAPQSSFDARIVGGPPSMPPPAHAETWHPALAPGGPRNSDGDDEAVALWKRGGGAAAAARARAGAGAAGAAGAPTADGSERSVAAALAAAAVLRRELMASMPPMHSARTLKGTVGLTPPSSRRSASTMNGASSSLAQPFSASSSDAARPRPPTVSAALQRSIAQLLQRLTAADADAAAEAGEGSGSSSIAAERSDANVISFAPNALDLALHLAGVEAAEGRGARHRGVLRASAMANALGAVGVDTSADRLKSLASKAGAGGQVGDDAGVMYLQLLAYAEARGGLGFNGDIGDHRINRRTLMSRLQSADAEYDGTLFPALIQMELQQLGVSMSSAQVKRIATRAQVMAENGSVYYHRLIASVGQPPAPPRSVSKAPRLDAGANAVVDITSAALARARTAADVLGVEALAYMRTLDASGRGFLTADDIAHALAEHFDIDIPEEQIAAAAVRCGAADALAKNGGIDYARLMGWLASRAAAAAAEEGHPRAESASAQRIPAATAADSHTRVDINAIMKALAEVEAVVRSRTPSEEQPPMQCLTPEAIAIAMGKLGLAMSPSELQEAAVATRAAVTHRGKSLVYYPTLIAALFNGAPGLTPLQAAPSPPPQPSPRDAATSETAMTATSRAFDPEQAQSRFMTAQQIVAYLRDKLAVFVSGADVEELAASCRATVRASSDSSEAVLDFVILRAAVLAANVTANAGPAKSLTKALVELLQSSGFSVNRDAVFAAAQRITSRSADGTATLVDVLKEIRENSPSAVRFQLLPFFIIKICHQLHDHTHLLPLRFFLSRYGMHHQIRKISSCSPEAQVSRERHHVHVSRNGSVGISHGVAAVPSQQRRSGKFEDVLTAAEVRRAFRAINTRARKSFGTILPSNLCNEMIAQLPKTPAELLMRFSRRKISKQVMAVLAEIRWTKNE